MGDRDDGDYSRGYRAGILLQKPSSEDNKSQAFEDGYIKGLVRRLESIMSRKSNDGTEEGDA